MIKIALKQVRIYGDTSVIATALGDIAGSKGVSEIARKTGLDRERLYKSLASDGNPEFATVLKVMEALGLTLHASPSTDAKAA